MTGSQRRRARVAMALLALLVILTGRRTGAAPTSSGRVVLLDSSTSSPIVRHCLTRIRQELLAEGFEVSSVDPGHRRDPVSIGRMMERQVGAVAVIALLGDLEYAGGELLILDRIGAAPHVRRIPAPVDDRAHLPEILSIRTSEVLKASALELLLEPDSEAVPESPPRPDAPVAGAPPAPVAPTTSAGGAAPALTAARQSVEPPASPAHRLALEAGISLLDSVGGPALAAAPIIRARVGLGDRLVLRATLAGLGSRPRVDSPFGSASVAQSFGLAELGVALRPGRRWRPTASLGAGALYVQGEGEGNGSYRGARAARWAGALDAGIGVLAQLGGALAVTFELHGLLALPHPTLRFSDVEVGTVGFPALIASLTIIAWL
jgi:hypothetical protein